MKIQLGLDEKHRIGTTSSSPFSGSPTFDEIPFHVDAGCKPTLGTYVIVEGENTDAVHYGRITEGTEENPRAEPTRLQQNQAYQVGQRDPRTGDRSPHVTRIMTVEVLGEIHSRKGTREIKEAKSLAQTGKGVYQIPADFIPMLLNTPTSLDDGLYIGSVQSGDDEVRLILPMEALARHIAVVGKTGVGKSYSVGVLIEELVRMGIPVFAFDVLGDFREATEDLNGCNLTGSVNFKVPYSLIGASEFLNFMPNLTKDQHEIITAAYERVGGQALDELDSTGNVSLDINHLVAEIRATATAFGQPAVGERAVTKVQAAYNRSSVLTVGIDDWIDQLKTKPVLNVFIGKLSQNARNLLVGSAARIIQTLRRRDMIPPCVFILDEAHFFLPSGGVTTPSTRIVREMIRTARHDAIGIVLISQSPGSMDKQALLTCNTRLIFALDKEDLSTVSGTIDAPDAVISRIPKLAKGTAILTSGTDIMRHSTTVSIRQRTTREGSPTPNLAKGARIWREKNQKPT